MSEAAEFARAVEQSTARPGGEAITTMMRLACEGKNPTRRKWAAQWLLAQCNVRVIDENSGVDHATAAETENLR